MLKLKILIFLFICSKNLADVWLKIVINFVNMKQRRCSHVFVDVEIDQEPGTVIQ